MTKKTGAAITTACIGMAVGAAAYMASGKNVHVNTKQIKRTTGRALRQVGDFIDNISYMMK